MRARLKLTLLVLAAMAPHLTAEPLSLPQAIELARQNSPAILESAAHMDAAAQARSEARNSRWPSLEFREVLVRTDSPADVFGLKLMQEKFSFPDFVRSDPNKPGPLSNFATEFQASMPLFTGGKITAGIGQADSMAEAATAVKTRTEEAVTFMVTSAYMDALLADSFVDLARKARDTTSKHVDQAQAYSDTGMIVESDLLQARVQLSKMEENLITAGNNASLARAGLNRVMGIDQSRSFDLDDRLPDLPPPPMSMEEARRAALSGRNDVRAVAARVRAAELGVNRSKGDFFPEVALVGKYSLNDDKLFGFNGKSYTVMAMAKWNLWNWGQTQARVDRSRAEAAAAREAQRAFLQQVEFEARQAWQAVGEAQARFAVASKAVESAEKALSILEARFEQGVAKVTDLLDAETMLNDARVRELKARFDVQRAVRALDFATGATAPGA
ncbi:MAG: TolC family protein [Acidobacteriota bacterium]